MKIVCECGEELKLIRNEDSHYTSGEGWYCTTEGNMDVWETHDVVGFVCNKCRREEWIFT